MIKIDNYTTSDPHTDPEQPNTPRNDRTEVMHQNKKVSQADFRLKLK